MKPGKHGTSNSNGEANAYCLAMSWLAYGVVTWHEDRLEMVREKV